MYTYIILSISAGRCDELQRPEGGKISVDGYDVGANASYSCFPGYHHIGVTERVCQASGRWTDCAPRCERECV